MLVNLNHVYVIVDKATFSQLRYSKFLANEFSFGKICLVRIEKKDNSERTGARRIVFHLWRL